MPFVKRYLRAAVVLAVVLGIVVPLACVNQAASGSAAVGFVSRSGDKLMLNGQVFRFSGANIYWGGLDENGRTGLNYPTQFRVNSALRTVADMGETVVRCQSCGISTGTRFSVEPRLGTFNRNALRHVDYFVAQAQKDGIRLDIPLTDNYWYYLGGYHDFTGWLGVSGPNCPSAACAHTFYTDPKVIAAFEKYISVLLNHVNAYTGVANKNNPTIMSWELGNELHYGTGGAPEFTAWTAKISAFIKSIAPQQLVMDGGVQVDPGDLKLPDVDIQSPHFYPATTVGLHYVTSLVAAAKRVLVVGEYAWNDQSPVSGLLPFLDVIKNTPSISGDIYWDLLPENDDFGFEEHYDGYQLHFPGDNADVALGSGPPVLARSSDASLVADLRRHAYAMSRIPVPPYLVPYAPVITSVEHVASYAGGHGNLLEWRGAAGAARYVIRRSVKGKNGPWTTVGVYRAGETRKPFLDPGAGHGPNLWYQVTAVNPNGVAGPSSAAFRVRNTTLDDTLDGFSLSYRHYGGVAIDVEKAPLFGGDPSRAVFPAGGDQKGITWRVRGLESFEALAFYSSVDTSGFDFMISTDGSHWKAVPTGDAQVTEEGAGARNHWIPYIYTIDNIQKVLRGARYVQIARGGGAEGIAELGEARINHS